MRRFSASPKRKRTAIIPHILRWCDPDATTKKICEITVRIDKNLVARCVSRECWRLIQAHKRLIPIGIDVTRAALMCDVDFIRSEIYDEIVKPQNGFHSVCA
jgi:hypothetical protein